MKILVIGAAGRTGRLVVDQAVGRGHTVTSLARRPLQGPGRAPQAEVRGDATDPKVLREALQGQDAVVSAVGSSAILRALIPAMAEAGVKRLVMTSSRSIVATRPKAVVAVMWILLRTSYADLARAEGMLEMSELDWTVVRGSMLTDDAGAGKVHTDFEADATGGDHRLPRADYAMALIDTAEDDSLIRRAVGVGGIRTGSRSKGGAKSKTG
ncbi:NAD(P)-dependent oxidoreductase [Nocardiopsis potens]|uniref:NAD(P)-dependent oxidoreductase n=1 Tax=Nocardiopsis potens TaxID=1246458 RepID=UPI00034DD869|nr:NAD(P)-binding oxidoreductase [Nocardiopsis potens]